VTVNLQDILAGIGVGGPHKDGQNLVDDGAIHGRDDMAVVQAVGGEFRRVVMGTAEDRLADLFRGRSAETDNGDASHSRRSGYGRDGVVRLHGCPT